MLDTGFPRADVDNDFLRARRRQFLAALAHRLRGQDGDSDRLVPLDEVTDALGCRGERQLGLHTIPLDTIIGTAGSRHDFDRRFRPTTNRVRPRWEQLALAQRRGDPADRGLPRRRPPLRQRRPPPGLDSRRNRSAGHRRLRDGGAHGPAGQRTRSPRLAASPRPPRTNQPCPAGQTNGSYGVIPALTTRPSAEGPPSASSDFQATRRPGGVHVEGAPRSGLNKGFTTLIVPVQEHFPLLAR